MSEISQGKRKIGHGAATATTHVATRTTYAVAGGDESDSDSGPEDGNDFTALLLTVEKHVAPLLRKMKGRARAASVLWADDHGDIVDSHRKNTGIGDWRTTVRTLWEGLPEKERAEYRTKARKAKEVRERGDEWFEYVIFCSVWSI